MPITQPKRIPVYDYRTLIKKYMHQIKDSMQGDAFIRQDSMWYDTDDYRALRILEMEIIDEFGEYE